MSGVLKGLVPFIFEVFEPRLLCTQNVHLLRCTCMCLCTYFFFFFLINLVVFITCGQGKDTSNLSSLK